MLPYHKVLYVVNEFKCGYIQKKMLSTSTHLIRKEFQLFIVNVKNQVQCFNKLPESSNTVLQEFAFLPNFDLCYKNKI